jgi:hypothetical protein
MQDTLRSGHTKPERDARPKRRQTVTIEVEILAPEGATAEERVAIARREMSGGNIRVRSFNAGARGWIKSE